MAPLFALSSPTWQTHVLPMGAAMFLLMLFSVPGLSSQCRDFLNTPRCFDSRLQLWPSIGVPGKIVVASGNWLFLAFIFNITCKYLDRSTSKFQCLSLKLFLGQKKKLPLKILNEDERYGFWPTAYIYSDGNSSQHYWWLFPFKWHGLAYLHQLYITNKSQTFKTLQKIINRKYWFINWITINDKPF